MSNNKDKNKFNNDIGEDYLLIYPKNVNNDLQRSIATLGFVDKDMPTSILVENIDEEIVESENKINNIIDDINKLRNQFSDVVDNISYNLIYNQKSIQYLESIAYGDKYFYFSALVPKKNVKEFETMTDKYPNTRIIEKETNEYNKKDKNLDKKSKPSNDQNYLLVYPNKVSKDVSRSVNTLGFVDKELPDDIPVDNIDKKVLEAEKRLRDINKEINDINLKNRDVTENISYSLEYIRKSDELKNNMAHGNDYFYMSGWVPESELKEFTNLESKYQNTMVSKKDVKNISEKPPTKLRNNSLVRPFEFMVNMYGAPNYDEIDPTPFFAITYMLLYGLMFGDLGQGLVFVALGYWLSKKNEVYGGLLKRIGFSASLFGLMYGSVFGIETLIPALLIKPFDNIMTVLIASVAFGVGLMVISYLIGIYNKIHLQNNIEEGIFGKEGLAGLMMMASFIIIVLSIVNVGNIPGTIGVILLILSIVMMVFKQPIARKIEGNKKLYDQSKGDYYVESSFSIIEALLSVFSNLVSFTRVGAFAINHVGLYMAFEVMAKLAGGGILGFIILVLGNILIIGLEGMIVGIQGLRLEFYEMFSKYYEGNGRLFRPIGHRKFN